MKRRIRRRTQSTPDLDITAFLNLMVILVPFLLITAVFSRITVLDLYLPPESSAASATKERFRLELIIRDTSLIVSESGSGLREVLPIKNREFDYEKLTRILSKLKAKYPNKRSASILPEEDIPYDVLIQVMDRVRISEKNDKGEILVKELFPGISIGDAPVKRK